MPKIVVIYFSATGTTAKLADAVISGSGEILETAAYRISGEDITAGRFRNEAVLELIDAAEGVVFGSPTYMGGPAAQFKAFADATGDRWSERRWANKVAAGFTTGTCSNGDQTHTLTYFSVLAAQHGMIWCNLDLSGGCDHLDRNRLGTQTGLATQAVDGNLPDADLLTAHYLGKRIASLALRLSPTAAQPGTA
ncbi:MAG: flavodoxin family protein [Betaproteobacteria bacterium]|nr:flavodoxin family protein [Betaproteobacteria bacterium]